MYNDMLGHTSSNTATEQHMYVKDKITFTSLTIIQVINEEHSRERAFVPLSENFISVKTLRIISRSGKLITCHKIYDQLNVHV